MAPAPVSLRSSAFPSGALEFYLFENVSPPPPFSHSCLPSKHGKKSSLPEAASSLARAPRVEPFPTGPEVPRSSQGPVGAAWEADTAKGRCARPPTPPPPVLVLCAEHRRKQPTHPQKWRTLDQDPAIWGSSFSGARSLGICLKKSFIPRVLVDKWHLFV